MRFLLFNEKDKLFFSKHNQIIYFVLTSLILFNISVSAHDNISQNLLPYTLFLSLSVLIPVLISSIFKQSQNWVLFAVFNLNYIIFSLLLRQFDFDIVYLLILNFFVYFSIKSFNIIMSDLIFKNYNFKLNMFEYVITDDFEHSMSYQKYDIPFKRDDSQFRMLQDELFVLEKYNEIIPFKNKLQASNFEKYRNISFNVPKSVILILYVSIIEFCKTGISTIETNPISFRIEDESKKLNYKYGKYIFEFKVNVRNLKSIKGKDGEETTIKHRLDEIYALCKSKNLNLKIRHGLKGDFYLIRIYFQPKQKEDNEIIKALNKTYDDTMDKFKSLNLQKSTGLTTDYEQTEYHEEQTYEEDGL